MEFRLDWAFTRPTLIVTVANQKEDGTRNMKDSDLDLFFFKYEESAFCSPKTGGETWLFSPPNLLEYDPSPSSPVSLFFISLIGNLSTLCEIKAENQCLVSNNFQTNLFHLFSPPLRHPPPLVLLSPFVFFFFSFRLLSSHL